MAKRVFIVAPITLCAVLLAGPAFACGGLIGPNGAVNLLRTATLAGYHDGVEHYITSFQFSGTSDGEFGSLVPLPGVPSKVERGGDWTLQRLQREVTPPSRFAEDGAVFATSAESKAQVLLKKRIDALDITILSGGAAEVAAWARENGFALSPDAPEVLEFYAKRSPVFMAAKFDAAAAFERGFSAGDGTPIHLTIPTTNPWVPLRILALGKRGIEPVQADVFLLTDRKPALLPIDAQGVSLVRSEQANESLMADLRADKGNEWIPENMWFSYVSVDAPASTVTYDLAVDASGEGRPSAIAAGLRQTIAGLAGRGDVSPLPMLALVVAIAAAAVMGLRSGRRTGAEV